MSVAIPRANPKRRPMAAPFARLRAGCLWLAAMLLSAAAAAFDDSTIRAAHDAYVRRDPVALERLVEAARGSLLEDYPQYWLEQTRLGRARDVDNAAIKRFLTHFPEGPLAERLRSDWLRWLGHSGDFATFAEEYPRLVGPDPELACYSLIPRLTGQDPVAVRDGRALWTSFAARPAPEGCVAMYQRLAAEGGLNAEDAWTRMQSGALAGNLGVMREVLPFLPADQAPTLRQLDMLSGGLARILDRPPLSLRYRAGRVFATYALVRLAAQDPQAAAARMNTLQQNWSPREQAQIWAEIATTAAMAHDPAATGWYHKAREGPMTDVQLAWQARSALRARLWPDVLAAVDRMSESQAREPAWRYWKARALLATGHGPEANALFAPLAREVSFYGLLAAEELGEPVQTTSEDWKPENADVDAMATQRWIARSLALYRSGLAPEGAREWSYAIQGFDDKQLLTAAEVARRAGWYERAINTADRTVALHDYSLRYPLAYREAIEHSARQNQLEQAWLFGLVRQESRFISDARSRSGAMGLMQLMPDTARWMAARLGWKGFHTDSANDVETNVALGTGYLRHILDSLGHPVIATAAYNAGPNRARRWVDDNLQVEGAVFAESIPVQETRDYVKKVMSNYALYTARIEGKWKSLKQSLGSIGGRHVAQTEAAAAAAAAAGGNPAHE